jgi:hypothetical protein
MRLKKLILLLFIFLLSNDFLTAQSIEYMIKASFIEKFARLTDWQANIPGNYFVIGIVGESPFNGELERLAKNINIKNKPIRIDYISNYSGIVDCQVLFICKSKKNNLSEILKITDRYDILTISDTPGFCKRGVHINFYLDDSESVKYEINHEKLKKTNMVVDMQVLKFGKIIR